VIPAQVCAGYRPLNTNGSWLESHARYDQCGSPRKTWDARGYLSEVEYSSAYYFACPTSIVSPDPDGAAAFLRAGSSPPTINNSTYVDTQGLGHLRP